MPFIEGCPRVDEVAALLIKVVEHLESRVLVALAHNALPSVAKVHGAQAYRTDVYCSCRGKYSMASQQALRGSRWRSSHCDVCIQLACVEEKKRKEKRRKGEEMALALYNIRI